MVAEGYKETEIGIIPIEWDVSELRDIGKVSMCKRIMKNETTDYGKIPFYKIGTFGKEADAYISEEVYEEYKNKYSFPKKGDILISASGTIGRLVVYNGEPAYFQDSNIVWIDNQEDKLLNSLLFYIYKTVKWHTDGNTIARLYNENLRRIKIPLPPLKEQEKIADILSTADEKIDAIASQIQKAETLKKGLLQKLLSEGIGHSEFKDSELGKIPESWEVGKLEKLLENKSILSHLDGNHGGLYPKQSEFVESGTPYLSANMIKNNNIDFSLAKFLTKERASKFRKGVAKDKDVLFAHNATVGPVTILKTNLDYVILSTTLTYYRCDLEKLNNYYLMNYMKSIYFINQYEKFMKQSTRNQIPITQQRQLYFIVPPLKEQKQIADILSTADEKLEVLRAKKEKYETLKKGLLQKLLSGEVRV